MIINKFSGSVARIFALYDALGRVAVTGTCQDAADEEWWSQPSSSRPAMTARRGGSVYGVRLAAEPFFAQAGAGLGHSGVYSGVDGGAQRILAAVRGWGGVLDVKDAVKDAPFATAASFA